MTAELACREVVELLNGYLDGTLDPATAAAVAEHLAGCEGCENYLDQLRTTVSLLGRLTEDSLSANARAQLVEAFQNFRGPAPEA